MSHASTSEPLLESSSSQNDFEAVSANGLRSRVGSVDDAAADVPCNMVSHITNPYSYADAYVNFHMWVFLREFLYHMFIPLAIPVIACVEGRAGLLNRSFWASSSVPGTLSNFLVQLFVFAVHTAMNVIYFADMKSHHAISLLEIIVVNALVYIRSATIAAKYAYQTRTFMRRFQKELLGGEDFANLLLAVGWLNFPPKLMISQLYCTEVYTAIDLSGQYVNLKPDTQHLPMLQAVEPKYQVEIDAQLKDVPYTKRRVHAREVCWMCLAAAHSTLSKHLLLAPTILTIFHTFLPSLLRLALFGTFTGTEPLTITVVICTWILNLLNFRADVLFLCIAALDMQRRRNSLRYLAQMVDVFSHETGRNWEVWLNMRRILSDFGRQYLMRLCWFVGLFFIFTLILLTYMVVSVFGARKPSDVDSIGTAVVFFDSVMFSLFMTLIIVFGSQANTQSLHHVGVLRRTQLDLLLHQEGACDRVINAVSEMVRSDGELNPIKLLGVPLAPSSSRVVMTLVGGVLTACIQQYIRLQRNDNTSLEA